MTREEHLAWCKGRALAYLNTGDTKNALASMLSDLRKHPETQDSAEMAGTLFAGLALSGHLKSDQEVRNFIEGFN